MCYQSCRLIASISLGIIQFTLAANIIIQLYFAEQVSLTSIISFSRLFKLCSHVFIHHYLNVTKTQKAAIVAAQLLICDI